MYGSPVFLANMKQSGVDFSKWTPCRWGDE